MAFEPAASEILHGRYVAVFSTLVKGGPSLACVWYGVDGDEILVATPAGRRKERNVVADGRVALLVDASDYAGGPGQLGYRGVEVRGLATIEEDPAGETWRRIVRRYLDPIPPETEQRLTEQQRTIIRIRPEKVRTWDYAGRASSDSGD